MNILPKKRWHVRTKQNIERVRRDEAKAAEEEKELQRRIKLAEQEARTDLLRKRARHDAKNEEGTKELESSQKHQHVNFFEEIEEAGRYVGGSNKEYELEKKVEKEKFEKNIGLLTYLGQSSVEATGNAPWYTQPRNAKKRDADSDSDDETASKKYKDSIDPLNEMKRYLAHKKTGNNETSYVSRKNEKPSKKFKPEKDSSKKTVEQLRAERLEREQMERERERQLLQKHKNGAKREEPVILDDRQRRYNSQFNPHLARQSLNKNQQKNSGVRHYGYPEL